jgi:hypothetical protein
MAVSNPIVDRIRIIPRPNDFLDRNVGSSGEVFYSKESNTLRLYGGDARGGYEIVTENNLKRNVANQEIATVKYAVTVNNPGSGNVYVVDGTDAPTLSFVIGYTYVFDQSDSTNEFYPNAEGTTANPHPINFSSDDSEGANGSGTSYNTGVIYILDGDEVTQAEYNGSKFNRATQRSIQVTITNSTPTTLYYYCTNHAGMGNSITVGMPGSGGGEVTPPSSGGASVDVSDAAPSEPEQGNIWFNSNTGQLFVYITDADSSQWVQPAAPTTTAFSSVTIDDSSELQASTNTTLNFTGGSGINITSNTDTNTLTIEVDGQLGVDLTAFSVGPDASASGSGALGYNNTTGVFTYTPPDLTPYLTSISGLNNSLLTNDAGFITGYTETQTLDDVTTLGATTSNNITVGDINAADITASGSITSGGVGTPTLTSASNIFLDAADAVVVQNGTFRFPSFTTTERNSLTPTNGDVIYNTTDNKFQGYENGAWANLI